MWVLILTIKLQIIMANHTLPSSAACHQAAQAAIKAGYTDAACLYVGPPPAKSENDEADADKREGEQI